MPNSWNIDLPDDTDLILQSANDMVQYEAARLYRDLVAAHPDKTSAHLKQLVADGLAVSEDAVSGGAGAAGTPACGPRSVDQPL